jgi:hypothetical protein
MEKAKEGRSTGDAVNPLAVVAFGGFDRQAHFRL